MVGVDKASHGGKVGKQGVECVLDVVAEYLVVAAASEVVVVIGVKGLAG